MPTRLLYLSIRSLATRMVTSLKMLVLHDYPLVGVALWRQSTTVVLCLGWIQLVSSGTLQHRGRTYHISETLRDTPKADTALGAASCLSNTDFCTSVGSQRENPDRIKYTGSEAEREPTCKWINIGCSSKLDSGRLRTSGATSWRKRNDSKVANIVLYV